MVVSAAPASRPVVGVSCCARLISGAPFHTVLDRYLDALDRFAGCTALLVPAFGERFAPGDLDVLIDRLDGILLTGARSMVGPELYGARADDPEALLDPGRDHTTLPLASRAVEQGVPLFAICRGLQELCCALGGTLEQDLFAWNPTIDHRVRADRSYEDKYRAGHDVCWEPDGVIADALRRRGIPSRTAVNTLHVQGIGQLPPAMRVEAIADDGLVEAASVRDARAFAFGVQWHPEWHGDEYPVNAALFEMFGAACAERRDARIAAPTAYSNGGRAANGSHLGQ